jgi:hypothetical protein
LQNGFGRIGWGGKDLKPQERLIVGGIHHKVGECPSDINTNQEPRVIVFGNSHLCFSYFPETTRWSRGYSIGQEGLKRKKMEYSRRVTL